MVIGTERTVHLSHNKFTLHGFQMVKLSESNSQPWRQLKRQSWTFVDGGEAQHTQYMHTLSTETLKPATIYSYRIITIGDDGESSEGTDNSFESKVFELHTPAKSSKGSSSFKFIATGDIGVNNAVSMPLFKQFVTSHEYDFVAFVGDQGYNLDDFNGTKGDEYMKFAEELYANLPILTTTGNHEQAYNFSHYKNRFDLMPYRESGFDNALQYSINYKNLHLVSFDTEVFFEGSEEEVLTALHWLEEDLIEANKRRSKVPWIIVFGHRPLYCSVMSSSDCVEKAEKLRFGEPVDKNYGLETLLSRYKVDLYLCGHKHNYERSYPVLNNTLVTTSYHNPPSFFQVITGNGGNYEGCDKFDDMTNTAAIPKWLGNHYEGYGFTTVEVSRNRLDLHHYEVQEDGTLGDLRDQVRVHKTKGHVKKQAKLAAEAA
ncbi:Metallo-dependent phosphatase-like protein [Mycotypha africana]|uniref:Metallo-dependent phosphatase-like protein n=1 Tax=Mycotypha africana TaxID=64632 RepID=UPI0023014F14|nr:Metallo-dependent phosphatase-like protein [Mycotypha africana]KAI8988299.1 Metallo-dependent phosphatase-like protein [Mycotypha africana]